jgi:hypothetical protein
LSGIGEANATGAGAARWGDAHHIEHDLVEDAERNRICSTIAPRPEGTTGIARKRESETGTGVTASADATAAGHGISNSDVFRFWYPKGPGGPLCLITWGQSHFYHLLQWERVA